MKRSEKDWSNMAYTRLHSAGLIQTSNRLSSFLTAVQSPHPHSSWELFNMETTVGKLEAMVSTFSFSQVGLCGWTTPWEFAADHRFVSVLRLTSVRSRISLLNNPNSFAAAGPSPSRYLRYCSRHNSPQHPERPRADGSRERGFLKRADRNQNWAASCFQGSPH